MNILLNKIKPPLRWAGGKTWLLDRISNFYPSNIENYYEPFIGGAAIFLNLPLNSKSTISDLNSELICFYHQIKLNYEEFLVKVQNLDDDSDNFYKIRNEVPVDPIDIAVRFYYLNRTCFNGLYRVNKKGQFNVPYGYRNITVVEFNQLKILNDKLRNTEIYCQDFSQTIASAKSGDLVFLDPPYTVAHNKNGFIEYNQHIFSWNDQIRLRNCVKHLLDNNIYFIMTNAFHESIIELYRDIGNHFEVDRFSTIGGKINSRQQISELIITNCR